jgi:hypothetical protein
MCCGCWRRGELAVLIEDFDAAAGARYAAATGGFRAALFSSRPLRVGANQFKSAPSYKGDSNDRKHATHN